MEVFPKFESIQRAMNIGKQDYKIAKARIFYTNQGIYMKELQ